MATDTNTAPDLPATKLAPPWFEFGHKIEAIFALDPEVKVECSLDGDEKTITVRVEDAAKGDAIAKLLPAAVNFGGVAVKINVVPANELESSKAVLRAAFAGNPLFVEAVETGDGVLTPKLTHACLMPEAIQFWNDNLGNPLGYSTFLAETVAKEIFAASGRNKDICWTSAVKTSRKA